MVIEELETSELAKYVPNPTEMQRKIFNIDSKNFKNYVYLTDELVKGIIRPLLKNNRLHILDGRTQKQIRQDEYVLYNNFLYCALNDCNVSIPDAENFRKAQLRKDKKVGQLSTFSDIRAFYNFTTEEFKKIYLANDYLKEKVETGEWIPVVERERESVEVGSDDDRRYEDRYYFRLYLNNFERPFNDIDASLGLWSGKAYIDNRQATASYEAKYFNNQPMKITIYEDIFLSFKYQFSHPARAYMTQLNKIYNFNSSNIEAFLRGISPGSIRADRLYTNERYTVNYKEPLEWIKNFYKKETTTITPEYLQFFFIPHGKYERGYRTIEWQYQLKSNEPMAEYIVKFKGCFMVDTGQQLYNHSYNHLGLLYKQENGTWRFGTNLNDGHPQPLEKEIIYKVKINNGQYTVEDLTDYTGIHNRGNVHFAFEGKFQKYKIENDTLYFGSVFGAIWDDAGYWHEGYIYQLLAPTLERVR